MGLHERVVGDVRTPLLAVFGVVALVLLLACVNLASLTLARTHARMGDLALRRSLGARGRDLLGQLLMENLVLAAAGGFSGVALARVSLGLLVRLAPPSLPRIGETRIDLAVLTFALAVSAATPLLFGLAPALSATRASGVARGARAGRGETTDRTLGGLLGALVVWEVGLALTLLVAAGLTVRTVAHLQRTELGFDRTGALTFRVVVPRSRYPTASDIDAFYTRLRASLAGLPGVTAVGAGTDLPLSGEGAVATVTSRERFEQGTEEGATVLQRRATGGFFGALGTRVLAGREFDARDRSDGEPVAIVSASLARELFGDQGAVGREIGWGSVPEEGDWMRVVGVVADVHYEEPERPPDPQIYQAHPQSAARDMAVVVRTTGDPVALLEPAREVLASLDPSIPAYSVGTLGGLVDSALAGRRFTMRLFGIFGLVALALAVAGLYGVLAFAVGRRRREIGVRIAIGASRSAVAGLVLGRGLRLVTLGLGLGALGAFAAGRLLRGLVVGVRPFDPLTLSVVTVALVAVSVVACLAPALGASRLDPVEVLRDS